MQCRYYSIIHELIIHEFDITMENFSIGMAQDLIVDMLISNVRFKRTISVFAIYTDKQQHGISADLLARNWGLD